MGQGKTKLNSRLNSRYVKKSTFQYSPSNNQLNVDSASIYQCYEEIASCDGKPHFNGTESEQELSSETEVKTIHSSGEDTASVPVHDGSSPRYAEVCRKLQRDTVYAYVEQQDTRLPTHQMLQTATEDYEPSDDIENYLTIKQMKEPEGLEKVLRPPAASCRDIKQPAQGYCQAEMTHHNGTNHPNNIGKATVNPYVDLRTTAIDGEVTNVVANNRELVTVDVAAASIQHPHPASSETRQATIFIMLKMLRSIRSVTVDVRLLMGCNRQKLDEQQRFKRSRSYTVEETVECIVYRQRGDVTVEIVNLSWMGDASVQGSNSFVIPMDNLWNDIVASSSFVVDSKAAVSRRYSLNSSFHCQLSIRQPATTPLIACIVCDLNEIIPLGDRSLLTGTGSSPGFVGKTTQSVALVSSSRRPIKPFRARSSSTTDQTDQSPPSETDSRSSDLGLVSESLSSTSYRRKYVEARSASCSDGPRCNFWLGSSDTSDTYQQAQALGVTSEKLTPSNCWTGETQVASYV